MDTNKIFSYLKDSTTMGIGDMVISFVISYAAGLFMPEGTIEESLDKCYKKALKRWTDVNEETKCLMEGDMKKKLQDLKSFIENPAKGVNPSWKNFLYLWLDEINNDKDCIAYITANRTEIIKLKLEENHQRIIGELSAMAKQVAEQGVVIGDIKVDTTTIIQTQKETSNQMVGINQKMEEITQCLSSGGAKTLHTLLPSVQENVNKLYVLAASDIIQKMIDIAIKEKVVDKVILAKLHYLKGQCLRLTNKVDFTNELNEAYELMQSSNDVDLDILEAQCFCCYKEGDIKGAIKIANDLQLRDKQRPWAWIPGLIDADDKKSYMATIPKTIKESKEFQGLLLMNGSALPISEGLLTRATPLDDMQQLTLSNLPVWIVDLTIALNRFLTVWSCGGVQKQEEIDGEAALYEITSRYFSLIDNTQITNFLPDIRYFYEYLCFKRDKSVEHIEKIKLDVVSRELLPLLTIMKADMLIASDREEEAYRLLDNYPADGINIDIVLNKQLEMAFFTGEDKIKDIFMKAATTSQSYELKNFFFFVTILPVYGSTLGNLPFKLKFSTEDDTRLYHELAKHFIERNADIEYLRSREKNADEPMKSLIANVYADTGDVEGGLRLIRENIDENTVDFRTDILIRILSIRSKDSPQLLEALRKLREQGLCEPNWLSLEINLLTRIGDLKEAEKCAEKIHSLFPNNNDVFMNYLQILNSNGEKGKIASLASMERLNSINEKELVDVLFDILHGNIGAEKALSFLESKIAATNNISIKKLVLLKSLMPEVSALINADKENVCKGDFIEYKKGDQPFSGFVEEGSLLTKFIGRKVGDCIKVAQLRKEETYELISIHRAAYGYQVETYNLASEGKMEGMSLFQFDENLNEGEQMKQLLEMLGPTQEEVVQRENLLNEYSKGEVVLESFRTGDHIILGIKDLIWGDFKVYNAIAYELLDAIQKNHFKMNEYIPVLDLTSFIVVSELFKTLNLSPVHKFIISQGLVNAISSEKEKLDLSFERYRVPELNAMLEWIDEYCIVEKATQALELNTEKLGSYCRLFAEALTLSNAVDRVFLTDDLYMLTKFSGIIRTCSSEVYLSAICTDKQNEIGNYLAKHHHIGTAINYEFIQKQYFRGDCNSKKEIEETIERNVYLYKDVLYACHEHIMENINDDEKLKDSMRECVNLIVTMIKDWTKGHVEMLYSEELRDNNIEPYISTLRVAVSQVYPGIIETGN